MGEYVVYVHRNKVNGKQYFGITSEPRKRWSGNGKRYEKCPRFFNAIKKYGWDGFTHEILESGLTVEDANERERYYIAKYQTTEKEHGYNIAEGGDCVPTMRGKHHTEEARRKIGDFQRGRKHSEKQNRQHSEFMKNRYTGSKNHNSKAVRCINTGEVFESQRIAAKVKGIHQSKICLCCQGKRRHTNGLMWEYVTDQEE